MADEKISLLPSAGTLDGTEPVPVVKAGVTKQTTTQAIADLAAGQLTADQLAAINGANSPDGTNVFATMADIVAGGNANITSIAVAALQALQSGSTLSQTTFYNVTNAVGSTRKLQIYAIANNTNVVAAIDLETGEIGTYDITGDVFVGGSPVWGGITGNILDQTDVGARKDAQGNVFIGGDNNGNTVTTSSGNVFFTSANSSNLTGSGNNYFGINANTHTLVDSTYNYFGDNTEGIILNTAIRNVFGNDVKNLNSVNADFSYCNVSVGLDFSTIDFTNATQLFGRADRWSINKVLDTDLIEVTFDTNLPTARTGQYDTSTDTFIPYSGTYTPTLTPDGAVCTAAALAADAIYSVSNGIMTIFISIDCTFDFTSNDATIDYTLPFGTTDVSGGNVTFNLNTNSTSLPISGYERNGQIHITTKDTAFNDDLTIYATITIKLA